MPVDIEELEPTTRNDYRRANGAPMVMVNGKNERYSRPSSFAKPLDDESALTNWKIDRGCIGVAHDRALQARWCAVTDDDRDAKEKLRQDSISAGRGAERADIGTALHAMSVRFEQELNFSPPQPYLESLQSYMNEMTRLNLSTVRSEFHTVNRQYRCAGTADRLYELGSPLITPSGNVLPVGTLIVGDLKTGEKLEYSKPAYAVQLTLYAEGEFYDVLSDEFIATPPINRDWAIIVHMPADQPGLCEFLWVDLEIGRWGAYLVDQIKTWRKMWRSGEFNMPAVQLDTDLVRVFNEASCWCGQPGDTTVTHQQDAPCFVLVDDTPAPQPVVVDNIATIPDEPAPVAAAAAADRGGLTSPIGPFDSPEELAGHISWAKERVELIANNKPARTRLLTIWPAGLPTPKQGIETLEQAVEVNRLLSQIEAEFQLSFVPRPAALLPTGPSTRKGKRNATTTV